MAHKHQPEKEHDHHLQKQIDELRREIREIWRFLKHPKPLTAAVAVRFTGDFFMTTNSVVLLVGQTSQASIVPMLADGVSPSNGALSNVAYNFDDPSATVVLNPDNLTATVSGVAPSASGAVTGTATCTVTDTDGAVSSWNQAFTVLVNPTPPPPSQLTQSIAVQFTTPA